MNLTLAQKGELDALVNFFGGADNISAHYKNDVTHRALERKGLIRWSRADPPFGKTFAKMKATKLGMTTAKRFKKDWSVIASERHDRDDYE